MKDYGKLACWLLILILIMFLGIGGYLKYSAKEERKRRFTRCNANLTFLWFDKRIYANELGLTNGVIIDEIAFQNFRRTNGFGADVCPEGGLYILQPVGFPPTCTFTNQIVTWHIKVFPPTLVRFTNHHRSH